MVFVKSHTKVTRSIIHMKTSLTTPKWHYEICKNCGRASAQNAGTLRHRTHEHTHTQSLKTIKPHANDKQSQIYLATSFHWITQVNRVLYLTFTASVCRTWFCIKLCIDYKEFCRFVKENHFQNHMYCTCQYNCLRPLSLSHSPIANFTSHIRVDKCY